MKPFYYFFFISLLTSSTLFALEVPNACLSSEDYQIQGNKDFSERVILNNKIISHDYKNESPTNSNVNHKDAFHSSCFGQGTKVKTVDGWKKIEELRIDDKVVSYDHQKNKMILGEISEIRQIKKVLCKIKAGKHIILATGDHPFYNADQNLYLPIGNMLKSNGEIAQFNKTYGFYNQSVDSVESLGVQVVYDIRVKTFHNFFINGNTLVHNW